MVRHQEVNVNASGNLNAKQTQFGGGKGRESKGLGWTWEVGNRAWPRSFG